VLIKLADGPMTLREIARAVDVDPPAATVGVDKLEARGLSIATVQSFSALGRFDPGAGLGWSTARRARLGGRVDLPPTDDRVAELVLPIARDLYPLFLLPTVRACPCQVDPTDHIPLSTSAKAGV